MGDLYCTFLSSAERHLVVCGVENKGMEREDKTERRQMGEERPLTSEFHVRIVWMHRHCQTPKIRRRLKEQTERRVRRDLGRAEKRKRKDREWTDIFFMLLECEGILSNQQPQAHRSPENETIPSVNSKKIETRAGLQLFHNWKERRKEQGWTNGPGAGSSPGIEAGRRLP